MSRAPLPDPATSESIEASEAAAEQLERANSQLALYARDLKRILDRERQRGRELDAAHAQLQAFAKDLKSTLQAERERSRELEEAYLETVMRLTRAAQYKDKETGAHLQRMGDYARVIALHVGLDDDEASRLEAAAPMHDVGKIGIPDAILQKPDLLDPGEWKVMRTHSALGASLLTGSTSPLIEVAREVALTHHECWDGSGYPQGLRGGSIPLHGRIVMLGDIYDALRSPRHYKAPFDHERALEAITHGDGRTEPRHFDPQILQAFRDVHRQFEAIYDQNAD
jgi:putative two-component system response regulator